MHGVWGGTVAGTLFVLPSLFILSGLTWVYLVYGDVPVVEGILYGIKPAVTAIVVFAAYRIDSRTLKNNVLRAHAVLVIKPGKNAVGKDQIRKAFETIAAHFEHSLDVKQDGMEILETGDTALVLANTHVSANNTPAIERKATYVFKRGKDSNWLCAIDNSYGHDLLEKNA